MSISRWFALPILIAGGDINQCQCSSMQTLAQVQSTSTLTLAVNGPTGGAGGSLLLSVVSNNGGCPLLPSATSATLDGVPMSPVVFGPGSSGSCSYASSLPPSEPVTSFVLSDGHSSWRMAVENVSMPRELVWSAPASGQVRVGDSVAVEYTGPATDIVSAEVLDMFALPPAVSPPDCSVIDCTCVGAQMSCVNDSLAADGGLLTFTVPAFDAGTFGLVLVAKVSLGIQTCSGPAACTAGFAAPRQLPDIDAGFLSMTVAP